VRHAACGMRHEAARGAALPPSWLLLMSGGGQGRKRRIAIFYLEELIRLPRPHRINLEEPIRLPSPHRINFSIRLSVCLFIRPFHMKTHRIFM
jgi:hypothetical protein